MQHIVVNDEQAKIISESPESIEIRAWFKKGSGTVLRSTLRAVPATVPDPFLNHAEIRDRSGKYLGYVAHGFNDEDISIAKQRLASDEPRYTTRQVLDHIQSLEQK